MPSFPVKAVDACNVCRFRQILKKIVDTKKEMGKTMRQSAFAMVEAKYAAGDFIPTVFDAVQTVRSCQAFSAMYPEKTYQILYCLSDN